MGRLVLWASVLAACHSNAATGHVDAAAGGDGSAGSPLDGPLAGPQQGCGTLPNCYSVYAHSNDTLYVVDLMAKTLARVGSFASTDTMTDLAVGPDDTIYVISATKLYTASPADGHVTAIGSLATCGSFNVALTALPDGSLWTGDYSGALCQIDLSTNPPTVKPPIQMSGGLALTGDLVAVADGTVFGTAFLPSDPPMRGTNLSNLLVTIDLATGTTTQVGATGYPRLYGTSYTGGRVVAFTHDGSGRVVEVDPMTGAATPFATFSDPQTGSPISFAGAGVNAMVPIIP
ncbi:MAG: hypothetical protein ACM31C_19620 [Acidobacteriota bacterium]